MTRGDAPCKERPIPRTQQGRRGKKPGESDRVGGRNSAERRVWQAQERSDMRRGCCWEKIGHGRRVAIWNLEGRAAGGSGAGEGVRATGERERTAAPKLLGNARRDQT